MLYRVEVYKNVSAMAVVTVEAEDEDEAFDKAYEMAERGKIRGWEIEDEDFEVGYAQELEES